MPEGASSPPAAGDGKASTPPVAGLAAIDLLSDGNSTRPTSRFEEYKVEGEDMAVTPEAAPIGDEPVKGEIEVVKVKRKKKKDSGKKRAEGS